MRYLLDHLVLYLDANLNKNLIKEDQNLELIALKNELLNVQNFDFEFSFKLE